MKYRKSMEDSHIALDKLGEKAEYSFFGVYDGHGGVEAANYLRQHLHLNVIKELLQNPSNITPDLLTKTFQKTDSELCNFNDSTGSTAVVALVVRNTLQQFSENPDHRVVLVANCGDSRAVLCKGGKAVRLSFDHRPSENEESKRVTEAQGFILRNRVAGILSVSRSFGDASLKKWVIPTPYTSVVNPVTQDTPFLILACDGIWDVMTDQEAVDLIYNGTNAKSMARRLVQEALKRGTQDNITAMVILF